MYIILIISILNVMENTNDFMTIFGRMDDPRSHINRLHKLEDILLIGIISVICGAETWKDMESFARGRADFFKKFLDIQSGTPSDDTFNRVFSSLESEQFESCFVEWVSGLAGSNPGEVISIDGKTIRGAKAGGRKSPIHMVSAWANESNLVLGQVKTDEKSNEITAIPKLLELIHVEGSVVSIDAMGCQKEIAADIIERKADYILAVKENQGQLWQDMEDEFRFCKDPSEDLDTHLDHGRIETRRCTVISDFKFIDPDGPWRDIKSAIRIESTREFKNSDKATETAARYYISSVAGLAEYFQKAIRSHWGIENKLHWVLDVAFGEDASRKRAGNAAQNFSVLNKIALNLLKNEPTKYLGIKRKRLKAAYDNDYLLKLLNIKV